MGASADNRGNKSNGPNGSEDLTKPGDIAKRIAKLVEDFYQPLYRYAYRLSGSATDADDITQETFCKAQTQLSQLRDLDAAKGWLFRILRNIYLHRIRADRQQNWVPLENWSEVTTPEVEELPPIDSAQLQQALEELPEVFRSPIILYYFEDFSYRDIAEQMDLPIGTVMSRLARAKDHLRKRLSPLVHDGEKEDSK